MMLEMVRAITAAIPTEFGKEKYLAAQAGDWPTLFKPCKGPNSFQDHRSYFLDAQAAACVRKLPGIAPELAVQRKKKAEETFYRCEAACKATNTRLAWWVNLFERPFFGDLDEKDLSVYNAIVEMRVLCRQILGKIPSTLSPSFSGGSTFNVRGKNITLPHKLGQSVSVTKRFRDLFKILNSDTIWDELVREHGLEEVEGNRFTNVEKDSEKDRGICIEGLGNVAYQLALGRHVRTRLCKYGIDIKGTGDFQGQQLHRLMAKFASLCGTYATIDLSDASDTICYMLVKLLLPRNWFELFCELRSEKTWINGKWVKLEKFSSMGNGFTFELETMLFYVIARVISGTSAVTVYGDDMIVPSDTYDDVISALRFFGFTPNLKKSFKEGPFRESCGADWFRGEDVRPVFLKTAPKDAYEWIEFHNRLTQIEDLTFWSMAKARKLAINQIPFWCRLWGPPGKEGCLWTTDSSLWKIRTNPDDWQQCQIQTVERQPAKYTTWVNKSQAMMCALYGTPSTGAAIRDTYTGHRRRWSPIFRTSASWGYTRV